MNCKDCKYMKNIGNHFIPEEKELTCGDCARLNNDYGCFTQCEEDSAFILGKLCPGFILETDRTEQIVKVEDNEEG